MRRILILFLAATVAPTGCIHYSSQYQPRQRGRQISLVVDDSRPALRGEGRTTSVGWLGGGLVERVEAVPDAASAARSYRKRMIWSAIAGIPSGACLVGGGLYYVDEVAKHGESYESPLGWDFLMVGCAGGLLVTQFLSLSARTYLYDAINLYNDGIDAADTATSRATVPYFNARVSRAAAAVR